MQRRDKVRSVGENGYFGDGVKRGSVSKRVCILSESWLRGAVLFGKTGEEACGEPRHTNVVDGERVHFEIEPTGRCYLKRQ